MDAERAHRSAVQAIPNDSRHGAFPLAVRRLGARERGKVHVLLLLLQASGDAAGRLLSPAWALAGNDRKWTFDLCRESGAGSLGLPCLVGPSGARLFPIHCRRYERCAGLEEDANRSEAWLPEAV